MGWTRPPRAARTAQRSVELAGRPPPGTLPSLGSGSFAGRGEPAVAAQMKCDVLLVYCHQQPPLLINSSWGPHGARAKSPPHAHACARPFALHAARFRVPPCAPGAARSPAHVKSYRDFTPGWGRAGAGRSKTEGETPGRSNSGPVLARSLPNPPVPTRAPPAPRLARCAPAAPGPQRSPRATWVPAWALNPQAHTAHRLPEALRHLGVAHT
jgi:hypothetical protein